MRLSPAMTSAGGGLCCHRAGGTALTGLASPNLDTRRLGRQVGRATKALAWGGGREERCTLLEAQYMGSREQTTHPRNCTTGAAFPAATQAQAKPAGPEEGIACPAATAQDPMMQDPCWLQQGVLGSLWRRMCRKGHPSDPAWTGGGAAAGRRHPLASCAPCGSGGSL